METEQSATASFSHASMLMHFIVLGLVRLVPRLEMPAWVYWLFLPWAIVNLIWFLWESRQKQVKRNLGWYLQLLAAVGMVPLLVLAWMDVIRS